MRFFLGKIRENIIKEQKKGNSTTYILNSSLHPNTRGYIL